MEGGRERERDGGTERDELICQQQLRLIFAFQRRYRNSQIHSNWCMNTSTFTYISSTCVLM